MNSNSDGFDRSEEFTSCRGPAELPGQLLKVVVGSDARIHAKLFLVVVPDLLVEGLAGAGRTMFPLLDGSNGRSYGFRLLLIVDCQVGEVPCLSFP